MKLIDCHTQKELFNNAWIERYGKKYEVLNIDFINKTAKIREAGALIAWPQERSDLENYFSLRFVE